jgi:hypothetical protein
VIPMEFIQESPTESEEDEYDIARYVIKPWSSVNKNFENNEP